MQFTKTHYLLIAFNAAYLVLGGLYFFEDLNQEFVIYVAVIILLVGGVFGTLRYTRFPVWMLALFSMWGLMHVLGGAVETQDGVLFAYRIYPFFDGGGDLYILKYDQVVHGYLYGLVALMAHHVLTQVYLIRGNEFIIALMAVLISLGISAGNEIMEFLIAINLERHGVGGYENAMLDLVFNLGGAVVAIVGLYLIRRSKLKKTAV